MDFKEERLDSEDIYQGKIVNLRIDQVKLPNGRVSTREVVEHSGGVSILALTEKKEILLVEQYRTPVEETLLELPAGKLEPGENPLNCARRELIEETGFKAARIKHLYSFYTTPGFSDELLYLYLASELEEVGTDFDEDEIIKNHLISPGEIMDSILSGQIKDAKTIVGLLTYLRGDFNV
ncbi:NUDIX hydrolase [Halocella sp. SP3-1]|uniref:NUDIX domain-containing protein n=1 Tax=Halocella sp. SP3-1 TaxID=2382161 RepID=UPI000F7621BA|nr:NUDIX hydrolase [Halocella sp. SP3-1]AZO95626.1 NUDIX hydrolase [Halocella sp. SP3-1]